MVACLSAVETEASAATISALLQPRPSGSAPGDNKAALPPAPSPSNKPTTTTTTSKSSVLPLGPDDPRLVARNRHGHTALHCAAFAQSPTAVRMLLRAGADCTIGDKAGRTAVEVALNLNKKSATVLREGPRGGSAPAAECLRLLKDRCACVRERETQRDIYIYIYMRLEGGGGVGLTARGWFFAAGRGRRDAGRENDGEGKSRLGAWWVRAIAVILYFSVQGGFLSCSALRSIGAEGSVSSAAGSAEQTLHSARISFLNEATPTLVSPRLTARRSPVFAVCSLILVQVGGARERGER